MEGGGEVVEIFKEIEQDPALFITIRALERCEELIKQDLGKININDVRHVLIKFARAVIALYERYVKIALFLHHDVTVQDFLYKTVIVSRITEFLKIEIREELERSKFARSRKADHSDPMIS